MSEDEKFLRLFGSIFFAIGIFVVIISIGLFFTEDVWFAAAIPLLIGVVFSIVGGGILIPQINKGRNRKRIMESGTRYTGKIYGYVEDKSCTMNGDYLVNIKVHYFDKSGIEREAIIPTGFTKGSGDYPIGATIDIISLNNQYSWIKDSVRFEKIYREEELMDDKPINPLLLNMTAICCTSCGASFSAAKGYVSRCPYCGKAINC